MVFTVVVVVVVVTIVVVIAMFRAAEVVLVLVLRDRASQIGAGFLIETEVDASVDPRVADIVSDLAEPGVVETSDPARRHSPW